MQLLAIAVALVGWPGVQRGPITNSNFENGLQNWTSVVYGAKSEIAVDAAAFKNRDSALRIASKAPSDSAVGQEIEVKPCAFYRFSGWVRTHDLDPHGSPVFGTFQVQNAGGNGIVASGENHAGTTDWTEVTIDFLAPASGTARITMFFCGWGRGTGTAWYANMTLKQIDLEQAPITITSEPLCGGTIHQGQYGQFIEYLCNLVPGMWAEKLSDGSFEGLSPYKFVFLKETDFRERPWVPCGAVNRSEVDRDRVGPVSGEFCERISVPAGSPCIVGVQQGGISVDRGNACTFSCWMRGQGLHGPATVSLRDGPTVIAEVKFDVGETWSKKTANLAPSKSAVDATLSIEFEGPGTLWLDNASLMPTDNVGGWRPDVVKALADLKPGVIRVGGSVMDDINLGDFEWEDTVGDVDHRKPFRAWGGLQPVGPGLEELVQLIQRVGAEPLICIRVTSRTPEDAASEIQYFNGSTSTTMGALRAKNGHPEPYGIKYWQAGNERAGDEYDRRLPAFCKAMRSADPSAKILSSFPTDGAMRAAGDQLDFLCPHHYGCNDLAAMTADFADIRRMIRQYGHGRAIKVAVTEWNTTAGDAGPRRAMLWTLQNALDCARYQNLMHRECDLVEIANRSNLTNSFCSGIIQTDSHRMYLTPTYYGTSLYSKFGGQVPLRISSSSPTNVYPDFSATLSRDGRTLTLFAVNESLTEIARPIDLTPLKPKLGTVEVWTVADTRDAGMPDVANSFEEPNRVESKRTTLALRSERQTFHFPRLSITAIRVPLSAR